MKSLLRGIVCLLVLMTASVASAALPMRTWVEKWGNDQDPCSLFAPCKTYAAAIQKTEAGGTVSTVNSGAYGQFTVTKSMTVDGSEALGSILSQGGDGIVVNALPTDVVILRNLDLIGAGSGDDGIVIHKAKAVYIENCRINGFKNGIRVDNDKDEIKVYITGTSVRSNSLDGLLSIPGAQGVVKVTIEGSNFLGNAANGIHAAGMSSEVLVGNSVINGNGTGLVVEQTTSQMWVESSKIAFNASVGVQPGVAGNKPVLHLSNCTVVANKIGIETAFGTVIGYENNTVVENGSGDQVTQSVPQQ